MALEVKLNGKSIPATTTDDLQRLQELLAFHLEMVVGDSPSGTSSATPTVHRSAKPIQQKSLFVSFPSEKSDADSIWRQASQALGRPATIKELLAKSIEIGFLSTAKDPYDAFGTKVRLDPEMLQAGEGPRQGRGTLPKLWIWSKVGEIHPVTGEDIQDSPATELVESGAGPYEQT